MRNINLSNFEGYLLKDLLNCETFYTDQNYVILYDRGRILRYELDNDNSIEICNLTDSLYPLTEDQQIPHAIEISYSFAKDSVYVFLYNGDIICIELKDNTCYSDIVGSITGGLKAVKWSPENEVLALVTGNDTVIVMTNEFDPVSEVELHGGGFGEKQFTTVGWGKKETQFRGSEGKYKACKNETEKVGINKFEEDTSVRISWRGDAEYFAVSCINPESNERYLRIFSKEGVLQYTSETIPGLEHSLDWKPSGNLIASAQRFPNKYNVCFIEKNGLKHGEFTLPFKHDEAIVKELSWNEDSRLLAILIEKFNFESTQPGEKLILIYCVNNYHWYCKYCIPFDNDSDALIKWDQKISNLLHVVQKKNNNVYYSKYTWTWHINKSKGDNVEDEAFVAVIDGSRLLLTSFKSGILPPPMCTYSIELPCQINQVDFAPAVGDKNINSNDFLLQLSNGIVYIFKYEYNVSNPRQSIHKKIGEIDLKNEFSYNLHWINPSTIASCVITCDRKSESFLSIINVSNFDNNVNYSERKFKLKSPVALLKSCSDSYILLHDNTGSTYSFDINKGDLTECYPGQNKSLIELDIIDYKNLFISLGLDKSNKFYINDKVVANNVTSFHVHEKFLLLTTLKHRLLCISVESDMENVERNELDDLSSRRIERGSKLVTSVLKGTKVVLQTPRGNLECIQPRALSFSVIGKFLDHLQYYEAFDIMRLQRINLNLLYDHNPVLFKENIEIFIEQIKDPAWISLFLSELVNEDVTKTMYGTIYKNKAIACDENSKSKVPIVCQLLERSLSKMKNAGHYVLPILTTYIKRGDIEYIESALAKVKKLKEAENNGEKLAVSFDEAFRYMLYLIDVEDLYKVALGMYDFDLVLLVANKSQKDPKEYVPFLNDLRKLEVNYQKYMIDKHLKRYERALKHLLHCGGDDFFAECITFIKTHKLYKAALKLVPHTTDRYKQICANYADELLMSHQYEEAGIMYSNSGSYSNAIAAFKKSGNWEEVISCSNKLKLTSEEICDLYSNLAAELAEMKRYKEASVVYIEYLRNLELAVMTLCVGKMFAEAFRIAELHNRDELIQAHVKPGILESYRTTKMQISSLATLFAAQTSRLRVVREKKLNRPAEETDGGDTDTQSESSTVVTQSYAGSRTTNRTFRSAKNRRKQERKLLSLKEGSPYEDLALIASLHNIYSNSYDLKSETRELNKCLIKIREESLAEELQSLLEKHLKNIEGSKAEIWTPDLLAGRQGYGPEATSNSIAASFMQVETPVPTSLINPRLLIPPETQSNLKWQLEILKS